MLSGKLTAKNLLVIAVLTVALVMTVSACQAADVMLTGAGATFPYPIYSKWFDVYGRTNPDVRINYQSIGSGGGIQQLKAGTVDFGASDAPLSDQEAKDMPKTVLHIPTVAGAVVVAYNLPGSPKGLRLAADTLANIYLGKITRWNDKRIASLNPKTDLPSLAIAVVHRSDGSGTSYIFTKYLTAVNRAWSVRVGAGKSVDWPVGIGGKGNEGVAGVVKQTPGAIGYVELAYAKQNKLRYASVRNRAGRFVEPTVASTTAAAAGAVSAMKKDVRVSIVNAPGENAYPIAGFTYILVYKGQARREKTKALEGFLLWAMRDGQKYADDLLYAPLPDEVVRMNEVRIKEITK